MHGGVDVSGCVEGVAIRPLDLGTSEVVTETVINWLKLYILVDALILGVTSHIH
jgi:hypothetical protein